MTHLESLLGVLQVEAVWAVPVAVNDVCLSIAVKVGQRHPSPVLISVFNSCHHTITHKSEGGLQISTVSINSGVSPASAATSVKVPSPLFLNRKLAPFSLSQKMSDLVSLRIGPTTTPRPPYKTTLTLL